MQVRPWLLLSLMLSLSISARAQDAASDAAAPPADSSAPAADAAPADSAPSADAAGGDAAAPAASGDAAGTEAAPASEAAAADDAAPSESASSAGGEPLHVYGGVDYAFLTASLSKDSIKAALGGADSYDSNFYRARIGARVLPFISVEGQYGVKGSSSGDDKVDTQQMYALYLVPTGVLFDLVEISAPIGYAHVELKDSSGKAKFDAASFGLNIDIPVYVSSNPHIPDLRIGGGGTVYYAGSDARVYGFQAGIRLDFKL